MRSWQWTQKTTSIGCFSCCANLICLWKSCLWLPRRYLTAKLQCCKTKEQCNNCLIVVSLYIVLVACIGCHPIFGIVATESHRSNTTVTSKRKETLVVSIYMETIQNNNKAEWSGGRQQRTSLRTGKISVDDVAIDVLLSCYNVKSYVCCCLCYNVKTRVPHTSKTLKDYCVCPNCIYQLWNTVSWKQSYNVVYWLLQVYTCIRILLSIVFSSNDRSIFECRWGKRSFNHRWKNPLPTTGQFLLSVLLVRAKKSPPWILSVGAREIHRTEPTP